MKKEIFEQDENKRNKKCYKKESIKRNNINSISNNNNSIANISRSNFINIIWTRWNIN